MSTPIVEAFTDGACSGNPGPGGWGVLLKYGEEVKELSGSDPETTNNRMELMAAIQALEALKKPITVHMYTDSRYVQDGMTLWLDQWQKRQWLTAGRKPVKNKDLWERLVRASSPHSVQWHWVKGHNGHPENERADALARHALLQAMMRAATQKALP